MPSQNASGKLRGHVLLSTGEEDHGPAVCWYLSFPRALPLVFGVGFSMREVPAVGKGLC